METVAHWTQNSIDDFVYSISSSFTAQVEARMEERDVSRSNLATLLGKSAGRVSQVLNDPGNLSLRLVVDYARALGMKAAIIAYDDGDSDNCKGPISPDVFVKCWEKFRKPQDLFECNEYQPFSSEYTAMPLQCAPPTIYSSVFSNIGGLGGSGKLTGCTLNGPNWIAANRKDQGIIISSSSVPTQPFVAETGVAYAKQETVAA